MPVTITLPRLLERYFPETPLILGPLTVMRQSVADREAQHQAAMTAATGALRRLSPAASAATDSQNDKTARSGSGRLGRS